MPADVPLFVYHVKPQFAQETGEELSRLDGEVHVVEQDKTYTL
jgi:hypothetical protein